MVFPGAELSPDLRPAAVSPMEMAFFLGSCGIESAGVLGLLQRKTALTAAHPVGAWLQACHPLVWNTLWWLSFQGSLVIVPSGLSLVMALLEEAGV